jgi:hypothetical protein
VRERYAHTPYSEVAEAKLAAAGIKPRSKSPPAGAAAPGSGTPPAVNAVPAVPAAPAAGAAPAATPPAAGTPAAVPSTPGPPAYDERHGRGRHPNEGQSATPESSATVDTSGFQPEGKAKEEIDNDYESVDQY